MKTRSRAEIEDGLNKLLGDQHLHRDAITPALLGAILEVLIDIRDTIIDD